MPVDTTVWGPALWTFLHAIAYAPDDSNSRDREAALQKMSESLCELLPCPKCRNHFNDYVSEVGHPTRESFEKWVVDLHNRVNSRTGKKTMTYAEARNHWLGGDSRSCGCGATPPGKGSNGGGGGAAVAAGVAFVVVMVLVIVFIVFTSRRCRSSCDGGAASSSFSYAAAS